MITIKDTLKAQLAILKYTVVSPLIYSDFFSSQFSRNIYFKCENFQKSSSHKIRGAVNRLLQLSPEEKERGVVTPGYGHWPQSMIMAVKQIACPLTLILPKGLYISSHELGDIPPHVKVKLDGATFTESLEISQALAAKEHLTFVHPTEDPAIIAGAGTIALEILDQNPETEAIVVPVAGGALISGIATVIKEKKPKVAVIGVQIQNIAPFYKAYHSKAIVPAVYEPSLIAGSMNIAYVNNHNYEIIQKYVDDFVIVSEDTVISAIISLLENNHLVQEGVGALALAALMGDKISSKYRNITLLMTGGSIDSALLAKIIHFALSKRHRIIKLDIIMDDRPGKLNEMTSYFRSRHINIIQIFQNQFFCKSAFNKTRVQLVIDAKMETREDDLKNALQEKGFEVLSAPVAD